MSSNISIQRICKQCNTEFTAKTTVTQFCSTDCGKKAYKIKERNRKIEASNTQTVQTKIKSIEILNSKEFLTVSDVASLLNCSIRTVYYLIENGTVMSVNLLKRKTIIRNTVYADSPTTIMKAEFNTIISYGLISRLRKKIRTKFPKKTEKK